MLDWVPDVMFPEDGLLRFTQFRTLVISARNWNATPRSKVMLRNRPASISLRPGPTRESRPTLPSAPPGPMPPATPGPLATNAALLNQCAITLSPEHTRQRCGDSLGLTGVTVL